MSADAEPIGLVLYGRPGCHLCDEAREVIERVGLRHPVDLVEVDIESDDGLLSSLMELIPVVEHRGERWFELEVDEERLVGLLTRTASIGPRDDDR